MIGQSRGGELARVLAVRNPDTVATLVMLGSPVVEPLSVGRPVLSALRRYDLTDPVLWKIAEIIHEADLDDEPPPKPPASTSPCAAYPWCAPTTKPSPTPHRSSTASTSTTAGPHCSATNPPNREQRPPGSTLLSPAYLRPKQIAPDAPRSWSG